eukprot:TRINITY_DN250_c0_g1_i1.p1 TRINITY_DN250_c0_g1~~TRINITY_DN250_c0_g1_i1.p1  ORF type:complete len:111 (-),score=9.86 TRINITY_DN250_c0_g1_i1:76-408(-)
MLLDATARLALQAKVLSVQSWFCKTVSFYHVSCFMEKVVGESSHSRFLLLSNFLWVGLVHVASELAPHNRFQVLSVPLFAAEVVHHAHAFPEQTPGAIGNLGWHQIHAAS